MQAMWCYGFSSVWWLILVIDFTKQRSLPNRWSSWGALKRTPPLWIVCRCEPGVLGQKWSSDRRARPQLGQQGRPVVKGIWKYRWFWAPTKFVDDLYAYNRELHHLYFLDGPQKGYTVLAGTKFLHSIPYTLLKKISKTATLLTAWSPKRVRHQVSQKRFFVCKGTQWYP